MTRSGKRRREEVLPGPQRGPETFHAHRPEPLHGTWRRPATSLLALAVAALAVLVLLLSGRLNPPDEDGGTGDTQARRLGLQERFLVDLAAHRPRNEHVVTSGVTRPGIPVALTTTPYAAGLPHRIAYRCEGRGKVTATAFTTDGVRRRFPATDCGFPIASLAVEDYRTVTLAADGRDALVLWAVTVTRPRTPLGRADHA
ncbi:hypothetical protein HHL19_26135 [Streptomyces sp. R302]|uniref:hypothetical protein n=1 Tax=unclassified Streptomyces TaxID=2593676 RepID=UPI00145F6899|nr:MULTISPECIES: hypothetical protein [unclassified Streptomyces]NML53679.1 hypothetical protein [Streptomyces sp. R301]NML82040.1 hypothetical protein [Streptomyces sp. R302]